MTFGEYQQAAMRTAAQYPEQEKTLLVRALGLCGEAGEVAEVVKKCVGHGHTLDSGKVAKELGDVLWYVATLAAALDIPLDSIAAANVAKLRARYPEGFETVRSVERGAGDN